MMNINKLILSALVSFTLFNFSIVIQSFAESEDQATEIESEIDLKVLIERVSEINKEIYILEESVKDRTIYLITPDGKISNDNLLNYFDAILNANGLSIVSSNGINKIINSNKTKEHNTPLIIDPNN